MQPLSARCARLNLLIIFLTVFIDCIGMGIFFPILPVIFTNPHSAYFMLSGPNTQTLGFIYLSLTLGIFSVAQFFASPIIGELSDRYGRKPLLTVSFIGSVIANIAVGLALQFKLIWLLMLTHAFQGLFAGSAAVSFAAMADFITPENRAKNFGLISIAFSLGIIIGPFLGGQLVHPEIWSVLNIGFPFYFSAVLSLVSLLLIVFAFRETLSHPRKTKIKPLQSFTNVMKAFTLKKQRVNFGFIFFFQLGIGFFFSFFGVFLFERWGFTQVGIGNFFMFTGIWIIIAQLLIRWFTHLHIKDYKIIRVCAIILTVGFMSVAMIEHWWVLLLVLPIPFVCLECALTYSNALLSRVTESDIQGEVMGISTSVTALSQSISGLTVGLVATMMGANGVIIVSGICLLIGVLVFAIFYREPPNSQEAQSSTNA